MTATYSPGGRTARWAAGRGNGFRHPEPQAGPRVRRGTYDEWLAKGLGWFSVGLGLTQVVAPRDFARWIGVDDDDDNRTLLRLVGLRELACGVGLLARPRPAGWLWARVAGDAMDLALLGTAFASDAPRRDRVAAATLAVAGVTGLDLLEAARLSRHRDATPRPARREQGSDVKQSITVNRPAEELYRFWHDFTNLPRFMSHLESVQVTGERRSHWKAKAPAGMTVEWDAEITEDRPNERIAWRSLEGADVDHSGSVRFVPAPGGRGTEVHVQLRYDPPGGVVGAWVAKLFGEAPEQQVSDDLRHFKQVMEVGEVVLSEGSFDGSQIVQRPAQPPKTVAGR